MTFSQTSFEIDIFEGENIAVIDTISDFFKIKKYDTLSPSDFTQEKFSIFPNPATSYVYIKSSSEPIQTIEMYSVLGQKVYSKEFKKLKEVQLPVDSFKNGLYLLKINNSFTRKLIIN